MNNPKINHHKINNNKMKKFSLLVAGIVWSLSLFSQNEKINWTNDLDYLAKELSAKHYNFFSIKSKKDFLSGIDEIKKQSSKLNHFQIAVKTQQLISKFGDSHTTLGFNQLINPNQILPIQLYWTSDGIHVLSTTAENEQILGGKILSINNIPIKTIADSLSTLFTIDNQATITSLVPNWLPSLQILEYFGFSNTEQVKLELITRDNKNETYVLKQSLMNRNNKVSIKPDSVAFCIKNSKQLFTDKYFANSHIYYIQYNKCSSKEVAMESGDQVLAQKLPSFKEFEEKALSTLNKESVKKIIFDMRYNSGGSSMQGRIFIEKLAKFLESHPSIRTYVVIGREVFSSAILNALDFKRLTNAIFVGEETKGKPNHFGNLKSFQLPTSKLWVYYSTQYYKLTDKEMNTLTPDKKIEMSFSDLMKGIDPVYEWIKQQ